MDEGTFHIRIRLPPHIGSGDYLASPSHSTLPSLFARACSMSDVRDLGVVLVLLRFDKRLPDLGGVCPVVT